MGTQLQPVDTGTVWLTSDVFVPTYDAGFWPELQLERTLEHRSRGTLGMLS